MIVQLEKIVPTLEDQGFTVIREPDMQDPTSTTVIATRPREQDGMTDVLVGKPRKNGEFHPLHIRLSPVEKALMGIDEKKESASLLQKLQEKYGHVPQARSSNR